LRRSSLGTPTRMNFRLLILHLLRQLPIPLLWFPM
jgi:hypothetical protein